MCIWLWVFTYFPPERPHTVCAFYPPTAPLSSWKGAREQERLSVFSYGVFTCDLHFDSCREAMQQSALSYVKCSEQLPEGTLERARSSRLRCVFWRGSRPSRPCMP